METNEEEEFTTQRDESTYELALEPPQRKSVHGSIIRRNTSDDDLLGPKSPPLAVKATMSSTVGSADFAAVLTDLTVDDSSSREHLSPFSTVFFTVHAGPERLPLGTKVRFQRNLRM